MNQDNMNSAQRIDGITGDTKKRSSSYVMSGHHCHHNGYELFYVQSGACRFLTDDRFHDLQAGDFILIPPMVLHYTRYVFGECTRTVVLFRREDLSDEMLECFPDAEKILTETSVFQVPAPYASQVEGWLKQIVSEVRIRDPYSARMQKCCLEGLLLLCSRVCDTLPETVNGIRTTDQQIIRAARYISRHYARQITTADVAREVGFSPNYLSRKFRQAAGIGLHEYIVFVRLHHAARELLSTSDSITTIALRCGFSDSNYFKDSFKKKYGVTPRNYRKIS